MIYIYFLFFIYLFLFLLSSTLLDIPLRSLFEVFSFVVVFSVGTVITAETEYSKMMMAPSGGSGSSNSTSWTAFEERVLIEPFPETDTAVNQPEARPVLPANQRGRLKRPCRRRQHRQKLPTPLPIKKSVRHFEKR